MTVRVGAATAERWDDVAAVLGGGRPRPDSCWCQRFVRPPTDDHRAALHAEIEAAATPIGLLAEVDGEPAGWSRVVPRRTLPGVLGNRALQRLLGADGSWQDEHAWWVTCVVVRRGLRGRGVGHALVAAAVDHARAHGASLLDGHPVDVAGLAGTPSPAALFTGTLAMFERAGFTEVGRTYPTRPVMRVRFVP